jgi:hypothetical protein
VRKQHEIVEGLRTCRAALSTDAVAEQDALSHDPLRRSLKQRAEAFGFKEYEMPVNQVAGAPLRLADLPLSMPVDNVKHDEANDAGPIDRISISRITARRRSEPGSVRSRCMRC